MSIANAALSTTKNSRRPLPPVHRGHKLKIERLDFKPAVIRYLLHCARYMNNQGRWCTSHDTSGKGVGRSGRQCQRYRVLLLEAGVLARGPACKEYRGATWMRFVPAGGIPFPEEKCPPKVSVPVSLTKPSPVKTVPLFPSVVSRKCESRPPAPSNTENGSALREGGEVSPTIEQHDGSREPGNRAGTPLGYAVREGHGKREREDLGLLWKLALPKIRERMDPHTFDCYLPAGRLERLRDGILTLRFPKHYFPPLVRMDGRVQKILEGVREIIPQARGLKILSIDHSREIPER